MMPGETQSKPGVIASDATTGTCQNCTILNQSLDGYVTALLTLKQKIIDTDHVVSEYREKCDELQKSQRESSKLHEQLGELVLKMVALEKQNVESEAMRSELEATKTSLKSYQQKSEEADSLKEENAKTLALKQKLEDSLKTAEETVEKQSLENSQLKIEKETLEKDLQKTQNSLKACQQTAGEAQSLKEEHSKTLVLKSNLENQLKMLEDSKLKQSQDMTDMKKEKKRLEKNLLKTQEFVEKLEREANKELRTISTQTETPTEPKIDKAKVRLLLEELWCCVEPQSSQTSNTLHFSAVQGADRIFTPPKVQVQQTPPPTILASPQRRHRDLYIAHRSLSTGSPSQRLSISTSSLKSSPELSQTQTSPRDKEHPKNRQRDKKRKRNVEPEEHLQNRTLIKEANESTPKESGGAPSSGGIHWRNSTNVEEILDWFKPLPSALSPVHSVQWADLKEDLSLSSDEEEKPQSKDENGPTLASPPSHSNVKISSQDDPLVTRPESKDHQNFTGLPENQIAEMVESKALCSTIHGMGENLDHKEINSVLVQKQQEDTLMEQNEVLESLPSEDIMMSSADSSPVAQVKKCPSNSLEPANELMLNDLTVMPNEIDPEECFRGKKEYEMQNAATLKSDENVCSRQIDQVPGESTEDPKCGDVERHLIINADSGPVKINGCSLVGPSKGEESDEQECIGLRRKVRRIRSRSGPQASMEKAENEEDSVAEHKASEEDREMSSGTQTISTHAPNKNSTLESSNPPSATTDMELENKKDKNCLEDDEVAQQKLCKPSFSRESSLTNSHGESSINERSEEVDPADDKPDQHTENEVSDVSCPEIDHVGKTTASKDAAPAKTSEDTAASRDSPQMVCSPCNVVLEHLKLESIEQVLTLAQSPETIGKARTEMGPPLPPVIMPLTATPPRFGRRHTPLRHIPGKLTIASPVDGSVSPMRQTSAPSPPPATPSPSKGVPSSPLQFGSATPKHAVAVPGRHPSPAVSSSSPGASPENSMQMLDTMYPELSARARTLTILRGNVNLSRAATESGPSPPSAVNQVSGFKGINSSSTAFTKTEQKGKRTGVHMLLPKSAKRLRLDNCSPGPTNIASPLEPVTVPLPINNVESKEPRNGNVSHSMKKELKAEGQRADTVSNTEYVVSQALVKIGTSCIDLLPVIKSHVFLGRISKVPVLRDEEKVVLSDFCTTHQSLADEFMSAILAKMKAERGILSGEHLQCLCRVYTGMCRQKGDWERAHSLAYSILKEEFPDAAKLILFVVATWPDVLSDKSAVCKAIHTVAKLKADGEVLEYLTAYLCWEKSPSCDIHQMISTTVGALRTGTDLKFQQHDRHGDDLCPTSWEYIFTLDLLCAHQRWKWTHDNLISKELWPIMNTWVMQPRSQQSPIRDVTVAAVLRLIGRLGQLGIKEKCASVQNVAKVINTFGQHGRSEGVPWEVQLAAIYTIYDLSPSNPKEALDALASWRGDTMNPVPSAVTSCITQIGSVCRQVKS